MTDDEAPDSTAVRVALWRAMHVQVDAPPHVLEDEVGLRLADPDDSWRARGDMDPRGTSLFRAGVVARAHFVEDLVAEQADKGVGQYVILGAGLDTFAQRGPDIASRLRVFEVDRPGPQAWKRKQLIELGYGVPDWLRLVPVDFEGRRSVAGSARGGRVRRGRAGRGGLRRGEHVLDQGRQRRHAAGDLVVGPGSTVVMTFMPPLELVDEEDRAVRQFSENGARASGTPFITFYTPDEVVALARETGFKDVRHVSAAMLNQWYYAGRTDGLRTSSGEELLVATS